MTNEKVPQHPILLVDDEKHFLNGLEFSLYSHGISNVECCVDSREVEILMKKKRYTMVFLDLQMPGLSGEEILLRIVDKYPGTPVIILTAYSEIERVVSCMEKGAFDYLTKPIETTAILEKVEYTLRFLKEKTKAEQNNSDCQSEKISHPEVFKEIVTDNHQMRELFCKIEAYAPTGFPVLISGETGVGKELFAKAIHQLSGRTGEFQSVVVGGMKEEELAKLLFGFIKINPEKGRSELSAGLVEKTRGGTLFLDEYEKLSDQFQTRLLPLVQGGKYFVNDSNEIFTTDTRIIAATNKDIASALKNGELRQDLYQRLNVHPLHIPPLRERKEDIPLLVQSYVARSAEYLRCDPPFIPKDLYIILNNYEFPGNVRELALMTFDAVKQSKDGVLNLEVFQNKIRANHQAINPGEATLYSSQEKRGNGKPGVDFGDPFPIFAELERIYFEEALKRSDQDRASAARLTGLSYDNFIGRLKRIIKRGVRF